MTKKSFFLRNVASIVACLAVLTVFSCCSKDKKDDAKSITVADNQQLTQTVYADKTEGASGVNITTTGAWTSSIAESPATKGAATPQWISISPNSGANAGSYNIAITLSKNFSGANRSAIISISCEGTKIDINVTQQSKKEDGTTLEQFVVTGNIANAAGYNITSVKLMGDDKEGDDEILATAQYQNNSFTIAFPETIGNEFLYLYTDEFGDKVTGELPNELSISPLETRGTEDCELRAYSSNGNNYPIYWNSTNKKVNAKLVYVDRTCAITGTLTDLYDLNGDGRDETYTTIYNLHFNAGWNWIYEIDNGDEDDLTIVTTVTTVKPNNVEMNWYLDTK